MNVFIALKGTHFWILFVSYLVANPEDTFSRDGAQIIKTYLKMAKHIVSIILFSR